VATGTTAAMPYGTMMEENWNGCVVVKNKPTIRDFDNCAEFFNGAMFVFEDPTIGTTTSTAGMPPASYESADWMRQRAFAKSQDGDDRRRCWVHLGNEGTSQHDTNKRIRSCHEYSAIRKTADWM